MKDEKNKQPQPQQPQQQQHGNTGSKKDTEHPSKTSHNNPRKDEMRHPTDSGEGDIENPDQKEQPGKKLNIDDDPDQTKKKVPNMHK